jgi:hypothetical protein
MANSIEHHAKLIIGDLVLTVAKQAAELEALRESQQLAKKPRAKKDQAGG